MEGDITENNSTNNPDKKFNIALLVIYAVTLLAGTLGVILMSKMLIQHKKKFTITYTSIVNLVMIHGFFLLTVPFRIDYYASEKWRYPFSFCKLVSIAIHVHLYISFFFYVAILVMRLLPNIDSCLPRRDDSLTRQPNRMDNRKFRPLYAFCASALVWILISITIFPVLWKNYGKSGNYNESQCFQFHGEIIGWVKGLNIAIAIAVILISSVIMTAQLVIMFRVVCTIKGDWKSNQDFRVQMKNLIFLIVLIVCFVPYHAFRIYYVLDVSGKSNQNEIYLSLTTLSCLDLLTFMLIQ